MTMKPVHATPTKRRDAVPGYAITELCRKITEHNSLLHVSSFISPSLQNDGANLNLSSCMLQNINYYTTRHNRPQANMKHPAQSD
jgi:hypothetical protein